MKNLIPALFVLAFAAPSVQAQSTQRRHCFNCDAVVASPSDKLFDFTHSAGHMIYPVTQPTLAFADSRRSVQISGVAIAEGKPVPAATVEVLVKLDGDFAYSRKIVADKRGFYATYVQAPARITAVTVKVMNFCSVDGGCEAYFDMSSGAGSIAN